MSTLVNNMKIQMTTITQTTRRSHLWCISGPGHIITDNQHRHIRTLLHTVPSTDGPITLLETWPAELRNKWSSRGVTLVYVQHVAPTKHGEGSEVYGDPRPGARKHDGTVGGGGRRKQGHRLSSLCRSNARVAGHRKVAPTLVLTRSTCPGGLSGHRRLQVVDHSSQRRGW